MSNIIIAGVDVETTGLDRKSEVVEVAYYIIDSEENSLLASGSDIFEPNIWDQNAQDACDNAHKISHRMTKINGLKVDNYDLFSKISAYKPNVIVAHNAKFDHRFFSKHWKQFCTIPWLCTMDDLDHSFFMRSPPKRLSHLALDYGFRFNAEDLHRAYTDAMLSAKIAALHAKHGLLEKAIKQKEDDMFYLKNKLIKKAIIKRGDVLPRTTIKEYETAGFRWDPENKYYYKIIETSKIDEFASWCSSYLHPSWIPNSRIEDLDIDFEFCSDVCKIKK